MFLAMLIINMKSDIQLGLNPFFLLVEMPHRACAPFVHALVQQNFIIDTCYIRLCTNMFDFWLFIHLVNDIISICYEYLHVIEVSINHCTWKIVRWYIDIVWRYSSQSSEFISHLFSGWSKFLKIWTSKCVEKLYIGIEIKVYRYWN